MSEVRFLNFLRAEVGIHGRFILGVLEWFIAFGFTFYLMTFWYDLRQAVGAKRGLQHRQVQMRAAV